MGAILAKCGVFDDMDPDTVVIGGQLRACSASGQCGSGYFGTSGSIHGAQSK